MEMEKEVIKTVNSRQQDEEKRTIYLPRHPHMAKKKKLPPSQPPLPPISKRPMLTSSDLR